VLCKPSHTLLEQCAPYRAACDRPFAVYRSPKTPLLDCTFGFDAGSPLPIILLARGLCPHVLRVLQRRTSTSSTATCPSLAWSLRGLSSIARKYQKYCRARLAVGSQSRNLLFWRRESK
jgi:hypothetical protein